MSNFNALLALNSANAPQFIGESSQTVAFSHYNNFSAQLPIDPKTNKLVDGGIKEQAVQCFENIKAIINSIDHSMNDIIRISIFLKNIKDLNIVNEVYKSYFNTYLPTRTVVCVNDLPMNALIQVDTLVTNGVGTIPNAPQAGDLVKLVNNTDKAPICNLSTQTVAFSHYNNITAQLPIDPSTGRIVIGGVKEQARQCLKNIKTILNSIDVPLDDIVKLNFYVTSLSDMKEINEVYTTFFPDSSIARAVAYLPACTVISVKELEMGARVLIEAVISHGDGTPPQAIEDRHGIVIKANNTDKAPICPLSTQTVAFSHYNHISGQLPIDVKTGNLVDGGIKEQTNQCLTHINNIVESINHSMEDIVKVNVYLKNISDADAFKEAYKTFFKDGIPALKIVGVLSNQMDALVQIDCVVANAEGTAR